MLDVALRVERREFAVEADFSVAAGECLALFGPSGSGKTTLLESVAGLVTPTAGRVALGGRLLVRRGAGRVVAVPVWQRRIGLLRQHAALFPHLSVRGNLAYASRDAPARARGLALLERLGLTALLDAAPGSLSGGQAERVALVRLLVADLDAALLDEPYTGLDVPARQECGALLAEQAEDRGWPVVFVAHELVDAQAVADRLAVIEGGRVLQIGTPTEVVARPATRRVATLVGYRGFLADPRSGGVAAIHPDRIVPGAQPGRGLVLAGRVLRTRPAGAAFEVDLDVDGTAVVCRLHAPPDDAHFVCTALDPPVLAQARRP